MLQGNPEKTAIAAPSGELSYAQLSGLIQGFSQGLAGLQGRVLLVGENGPDWIIAFYAILSQGLVAVPLDQQATSSDIRYVIDDCQPAAIYCCRERREAVLTACQGLPTLPRIIGIEDYQSPSQGQQGSPLMAPADPESVALIIYTSGTTGSPKGVMLSYANLFANMEAVSTPEVGVYGSQDRVMMLLPVHHIFPLLGTIMIPLFVGATIVVCPSMAGEVIIKTLQKYRVTIIIGVPRLYSMIRSGILSRIEASGVARWLFALAAKISKPGFSKLIFGSVHRKFGGALRVLVSGGAALDAQITRDFMTLGFALVEGYGMTEAAPMITFNRPGRCQPGSPGQALEGVEIAIVDDEILVRGPNVMKGYYNRPQETAEIMRDGWLHTGDLGELDNLGYLRITGRRKEIIVLSNGKNINPTEIETVLEGLDPAIREAGVCPSGDKLHALLVLDTQKLSDRGIVDPQAWVAQAVIANYNAQAASYKLVAGFSLISQELPRTRLGKLRRFQLPELVSAPNSAAPVTKPNLANNSPEYKMIAAYLSREKRCAVSPGSHLLLDLGLDSLDAVGFQGFIESSFGVQISLEDLLGFETVEKLTNHIAATKTRQVSDNFDWSQLLRQTLRVRLPRAWLSGQVFRSAGKILFRLLFRFRVSGLRHIPDSPCIIAPNHQSFFDAFLIASALKFRQLSKTFFFAKAKHIQGGFLHSLAQRHNIIVMDLDKNLKESIVKVAEVLKSRRNIIIFPEGTRSRDGSLGDFKRMFAILARELNVPVIPVSIQGAWQALPHNRRLPQLFKPINLDFLPAIYPGECAYEVLAEKVRSVIERKLASDQI